ncbi:c-type cytochrome [Mesorhizobium sp. B2-3-5]|uniref:c-type cytochrome n=1 Tax=Mesorhizobium sp. B2-3-5 TaxID=2589958 RepID=UPI0015E3A010|nr:c-type cytochrome [Mesorhizobium sp. B2-3-5]
MQSIRHRQRFSRHHIASRGLAGLLLFAGGLVFLLRVRPRVAIPSSASDVASLPRDKLMTWSAAFLGGAVFVAGAYLAQAWRAEFLSEAQINQQTGGEAARAIPAMIRNGCGGCHEIPGVPGARGTVGPSLAGVSRRFYIGGTARTSSDVMIRWISRARDVDPKTAMPNTNLSPQEARDIAAYLYART